MPVSTPSASARFDGRVGATIAHAPTYAAARNGAATASTTDRSAALRPSASSSITANGIPSGSACQKRAP